MSQRNQISLQKYTNQYFYLKNDSGHQYEKTKETKICTQKDRDGSSVLKAS